MIKKKSFKKKSIFSDEKGSISYFIVFMILVIMLSFLFGIGIPFLQTYTISIRAATDDLLADATSAADNISDVNARIAIQSSLAAQGASLDEHQAVYASFIQYSSIIIIFIIGLILFMASRRDVEQGLG